MDVKDKKIWILGAAKSGIAAAKLLKLHGADVFVSDSSNLEPHIKSSLIELKIPFEEGGHSIDKILRDADLLMVSPSVPLSDPIPLAALQAGIRIVSEIEIASWFVPDNALVIGITGTNGKSTTTHYAQQLFSLAQRNSVACGNYGRAFSDALLDPAKFNAFVVEVSSYQLETTFSLQPHVSIFLNLQNDHQARYGSLDEYLKAKWRLLLLTRADGLAVVDYDVLRRAIDIGLSIPKCRLAISYGFLDHHTESMVMETIQKAKTRKFKVDFSNQSPLPIPSYGNLATLNASHLIESHVTHTWMMRRNQKNEFSVHVSNDDLNLQNHFFEIEDSVLPGDHNQINILLASMAAIHTGLHPNIVRAQWNRKSSVYVHLSHRLEEVEKEQCFVKTSGQVVAARIINDSKATNVESTLVAIKSFHQPLRLLLGGEPKGDSYGDLLPYLSENVVKIYPFGRAAPLVYQQLEAISEKIAPSSSKMLDAAQRALDDAQDGDIILLSPACASFDEFKNFEHRGDSFKHWATQRRAT